MNTIPKRRWQFSLRWLLLLTTILCIVLARVAYFRQRAVFHEQEADRYWIHGERMQSPDDFFPYFQSQHHRYTAFKYRRAMYRPWTIVYETPFDMPHLALQDAKRRALKP